MNISRCGTRSYALSPLTQKETFGKVDSIARRFFVTCTAPVLYNAVPVHEHTSKALLHHQAEWRKYRRANNEHKVSLLLKAGLDTLLQTNTTSEVTPCDVKEAWERLRHQRPDLSLPEYTNNEKVLLERHVLRALGTYDPMVQEKQIVEDLQEAFVIASPVRPQELIPLSGGLTGDSQCCFQLLNHKTKNGHSLIFEDGSGNGAHLAHFASFLWGLGRSFFALGTDISPKKANLAQLLVQTTGLGPVCRFLPAHALHRASPRQLAHRVNNIHYDRYILFAFRLIPVLTESKIRKYLKKLSEEMKQGDLWCGSIALPGGSNYDKHMADKRVTVENTTFGAKTLLHRPEGLEISANITKLDTLVQPFEVTRYPGDLDKFILNTYMTQKQFEDLIAPYGFKLAAIQGNPRQVDEEYTKYTCVVIEKK